MRALKRNHEWVACLALAAGIGCGSGGARYLATDDGGAGDLASPGSDGGAVDLAAPAPDGGVDLAGPPAVDLAVVPADQAIAKADLAPPPADLAKQQADLAPPLPALVTITISGATVAPFKADGTEWDGPGKVDQKTIDGLAAALVGGNSYAVVTGFLGGQAILALTRPDPFGTGEVFVGGGWINKIDLATTVNNVENTFAPAWPGPPAWQHVPLAPTLRVRVHGVDEDLVNHDVIGDAEIGYAALVQAWQSQNVVQVQVSGQTQNQLLFVGLSVVGE
ncbi:MAG: hypothetical protein EXR72_08665 [Myxococcales bacterium]|nr:hypothetical protein [Myxococcales bacterium]